ncbi:cytochrome-c oxidase, cbb3-type subunit III [Sandaracinobacter neustonicus]|uniref:Cbb3-type cytochrome c oxidase subunit n=1 Tax=Sandaracinobacter neustonicus TaxID=1715348 RepID=A0A501XDE0_9SPHN|nr:cytochrome-c oxidase, cbb3-type subunit III [Sandaracinobacter neustonicus]TPE58591.1 cytochrome-c oxidase, cbb3-type subunit III [Sandaracinobacter neustonicus]
MSVDPKHSEAGGPGTTGHEWDGIQELNNPLPRWWLWIFYATIAFALVWVVLYPAIPVPGGYTRGTLGYSTRGQGEQALADLQADRNVALKGIDTIPLNELKDHPQLMQAAIEGGRSAFKVYCIQCHGTGAAGAKGYPNLNDDDWLWGGSMEEIHATIVNGARQPDNDNTHVSAMPAFGRDGILTKGQIGDVVEHVLALSGQPHNAAMAVRGKDVFAAQCASCHGPNGEGMREFGAPNLKDGIWLYGGDRATITATVTNSRAGVMPAWKEKLPESTIRQLTAYVHSLGGGE